MSRRDDYADRPRPRRRRSGDDYDDYPSSRICRSSAVTAVGVFNIIIGSFFILGSMCSLLGGLVFSGFMRQMEQKGAQQGHPIPQVSGVIGAITLVATMLIMLWGAAWVVTGYYVIRRMQWARIVTFLFAGLAAVLSVFFLVYGLLALSSQMEVDGAVLLLGGNLFMTALSLGYSIFAFVALLKADNTREFE